MFEFLSPHLLWLLSALPVLWWLLRVLPPRPRTVRFPGLALLRDLHASAKSSARTPWWLILLRCACIAAFIFAFAGPVLHPAATLPGAGAVTLVVDNGWASASHWRERMAKAHEIADRAGREGRALRVIATASDENDLERIAPRPWPADYAAALKKLPREGYAVFLSDGLAEGEKMAAAVADVVADDAVNDPLVLREGYTLERLRGGAEEKVTLVALTAAGAVTDEMAVTFPAGEKRVSFDWNMPPGSKRRTARLAVRGRDMASAVLLADASWRRHPAGIVADAARKDDRDFLSDIYYLRRALEAEGGVTLDALPALLDGSVAALVLPDGGVVTPELEAWVNRGGYLIRFAGSRLAASEQPDDLLPVALRAGGRALSGAMTWEKPLHLGAISETSPLRGLAIPADVTVTRQVLAEPSPETFEKTWLSLEDGTPLITAARRGKGMVVLIHTSAGPDWSNFCYSGLFVEALQRMTAQADGIGAKAKAGGSLRPLSVLDGFGQSAAPGAEAESLAAPQDFAPGPRTPPGLYGEADDFRAFNLGDALLTMKPLEAANAQPYAQGGEKSLQMPLLLLALLLLLADTAVSLRLRGALVLAMFLLSSGAAQAELRIAYVETGDAAIDRTSEAGLSALREAVNARTSAKVKGVDAVDLSRDDLAQYPVVYWPMSLGAGGLPLSAVNNVQLYMARGGLVLFDTRDGQFGGEDAAGARKLRELTQSLNIPELMEIPKDHILARSFYLLDDFPGRYEGGRVWVEKEPDARHDGVPSVIIGGNDWAGAWAQGQEMPLRVGVNLMMIALTGSYKADQIHVRYILERLGK